MSLCHSTSEHVLPCRSASQHVMSTNKEVNWAFSHPGTCIAPLTPWKLGGRKEVSRSFLTCFSYTPLHRFREASWYFLLIHLNEANKRELCEDSQSNVQSERLGLSHRVPGTRLTVRTIPRRRNEGNFFRQGRNYRVYYRIRNFMTWGSINLNHKSTLFHLLC